MAEHKKSKGVKGERKHKSHSSSKADAVAQKIDEVAPSASGAALPSSVTRVQSADGMSPRRFGSVSSPPGAAAASGQFAEDLMGGLNSAAKDIGNTLEKVSKKAKKEVKKAADRTGELASDVGKKLKRTESTQIANLTRGSDISTSVPGRDFRARGKAGADWRQPEDPSDAIGPPPGPFTPNIVLHHVPFPNRAIDAEGHPVKNRDPKLLGTGVFVSSARKASLRAENPQLLERQCQTSVAEYLWNVDRDTAPDTPLDWTKYFLLAGPRPGKQIDRNAVFPGTLRKEKIKAAMQPKKGAAVVEVETTIAPEALQFRNEVFKQLSAKNNGKLSKTDAEDLARLLGYVPDQRDLEKLTDGMNEHQFDAWLRETQHPEDRRRPELQKPFRVLDAGGTGKISMLALIHILTNFGEPVQEEEIKSAMRFTAAQDGERVSYPAFIDETIEFNRNPVQDKVWKRLGLHRHDLPEQPEITALF